MAQMYPKEGPNDPGSLNLLDLDRYQRAQIPSFPPPKQDPKKRVFNFNEVFLGYDEEQAVVEAARCIHCPSPEPCILGCPVHNDIPTAMLLIEQRRFVDAANVFRATSNMPEVCGRICPQESLCEGSCTVAAYERAVNIGKLEAYCTDFQRTHYGFPMYKIAPSTGRRVAIVGSGPAGMSAAEELMRDGHQVVVYEEWPKPGGLNVYGIPGFKLYKQIIAEKVEWLEKYSVKFICDTRVGQDISLQTLMDENDAVLLAIGAPIGNKARLPGEDLKGIYQATEFLVRANLPLEDLPKRMRSRPEIGKHMAVIGGGDTSMDCVRSSIRLQRQSGMMDGVVTDYYRRTEHEMPGREEERMHAKQEGVQFEFLVAPVQFIGDENGHVREMELQRMALGAPDASGRRSPQPIEGSNFRVPADIVVLALGYSADPTIGNSMPELEKGYKGLFKVESEFTGATNIPGLFAAGDDVRGADLVVTAIAAARHAARAMDDYLRELQTPPKGEHLANEIVTPTFAVAE
ncbi:MAG TPA: NAD(P)-dependent oxidoreductase [Anaerolineae bacterium]|nr:NAD(P)-dependent oxidoreductase [Anaerolineae bacterium]